MATLVLALLIAAAPKPGAETVPPLGWWPPFGQSPHPTGLAEETRIRVAFSTVDLGGGRSGVFVSRTGLILTSAAAVARCVDRLRASGRLDEGPFLAASPKDAPECPTLRARLQTAVRDASMAVNAAHRAGSTKVESSLTSACERMALGRRCELVSTEDGRHRLIARRDLGLVRLRYHPGTHLSGLGGPERAFARPRLRLDAALVSVETSRFEVKEALEVEEDGPALGDAVFLFHHPGPTLRWTSVLEKEVFAERILPVLGAAEPGGAGKDARLEAAVDVLLPEAPRLVLEARRRELELLERLRRLDPPLALELASGFTRGRDEFRSAAWSTFVKAGAPLGAAYFLEAPRPSSSPPEALSAYQAGQETRRRARLRTGVRPTGPGGRGDLRVSRGVVKSASLPGGGGFITWKHVLEAARRLDLALELPAPLSFPEESPLGFVVKGDVGPLVTGGPVVNAAGALVGIISGGDERTLAGHFAVDPEARVAVTRAEALVTLLRTAYGSSRAFASDARALLEELSGRARASRSQASTSRRSARPRAP